MAFLEYREEALQDATDRLVYKLVRVEEDGTIVPASENEVMEMESLMEGKSPVHVNDPLEIQLDLKHSCIINKPDHLPLKEKSSIGSKCLDLPEANKQKLLAQLMFLDALLDKLDEEQMKSASADYLKHHKLSNCKWESNLDSNIKVEACMELRSPLGSNMDNWPSHSHGSFLLEKPGHADSIMKNANFDLFEGNVSLDKLSIRELHEAFRTTLGQHAVMKDKLWLKERITMGLEDALETTDSDNGNDISLLVRAETTFDSARVSKSPPAETIGVGTTQTDANRLHDTGFSLNVGSGSVVTNKGYERNSAESILSHEHPEHKKHNKDSTSSDNGNGNSMLVHAEAIVVYARASTSPTAGTIAVETAQNDTNRLPDTDISLKESSKTIVTKKGHKRNSYKSGVSDKLPRHKKKNHGTRDYDNRNGNTMLDSAKAPTASRTRSGTNRLPDTAFSSKVGPKPVVLKKGSKRKSSESLESVVSHEHPKNKKNSQIVTSEDSGNMGKSNEVKSSENKGKRKRRPTRRYIEELAACDIRDGMYTGLCSSALKDDNQEINETNISLEDEGVQSAVDNIEIPEIKPPSSYKRRGRARKNRKNTNSSGRAARLVRKAISAHTARRSVKSTHIKIKIKPLPTQTSGATSASSLSPQHNMEIVETASKHSEGNSSKNGVPGEKNPKSRKYAHPWTVKEVVKLLEGVTHCGIGKWVDIKKFSFPGAADRSSTDVKEKWRNLVRASNRHYKLNLQRGEHRRKHLGSHLPGDILMQVHELFTASPRGQRSKNGHKSRRKASGK